jgi:hypothetical protein
MPGNAPAGWWQRLPLSERLRIIEKSRPLTTFLASDSRFDAKLQQNFLAASMPTEVLEALVEPTDSGYADE